MSVAELTLHGLALLEPWRTGQGRPANALDPTWEGYESTMCNGQIQWEPGTPWWICTSCGHVSHWKHQQHYTVMNPLSFFLQSLRIYFQRRTAHAVPFSLSLNQALFIAGVALRYSTAYNPTQISNYVQEHLIVK